MKYKLLNKDLTTYENFKWEVGKTYIINEPGNDLCTNKVFHCYESPECAILFNPIHANIRNPICYSVECGPIVNSDGLKMGTKSMKLKDKIKLPNFSLDDKIIFAILCTKAVLTYKIPKWDAWADKYLVTNTTDAADIAHAAAYAAACAEANAAAYAAAHAAACAAKAVYKANTTYAAAYAVDMSVLNFTALAKQAKAWR